MRTFGNFSETESLLLLWVISILLIFLYFFCGKLLDKHGNRYIPRKDMTWFDLFIENLGMPMVFFGYFGPVLLVISFSITIYIFFF
tara:strand:+ start:165 stop:422 length:258 start_codon:yes stop_codon:yes gene_type:complete